VCTYNKYVCYTEENNSNIIKQFIPITNLVENGFVMYGDEENDEAEVQDQEKNTEIGQSMSTINKATEIQVLGQNTDELQDVWNTTRPRPIE